MKKRYVILAVLGVLGIISIIFLYGVYGTYKSISPFMDDLFEKADKIENNQELTDSILVLQNLHTGEEQRLNIAAQSKLSLTFIATNKTLFKQKLIDKNDTISIKYFVVNDTVPDSNAFMKERQLNYPLFYCDTIALPFKYKTLMYPYTMVIEKGKITKSYVGKKR